MMRNLPANLQKVIDMNDDFVEGVFNDLITTGVIKVESPQYTCMTFEEVSALYEYAKTRVNDNIILITKNTGIASTLHVTTQLKFFKNKELFDKDHKLIKVPDFAEEITVYESW